MLSATTAEEFSNAFAAIEEEAAAAGI